MYDATEHGFGKVKQAGESQKTCLGIRSTCAQELAQRKRVTLGMKRKEAIGCWLLAAACWLFHYHMLGAGDVKLAAFVLLAAPGDGTGILLAGLCLAALYGLARMMKKRMLMDRFLYLLMWAGSFAGSKTVYYDDLRDGPKAAVPLAFFILVSACAYTLAG